MDGTLGNERALLQDGRECDCEPYYQCSDSLQSLNVIPSSTLTSILVRKSQARDSRNDEIKCVDVSKDYENYFNAIVLAKVNTKRHGPKIYSAKEEFYPILHRLLIGKRNWGLTIQFRDHSIFMIGVLEWTKRMLIRFEEPLKRAGIFDAVSVSQFSYHLDANLWQAFCELWDPLTNTLPHGAGEVGISLYDLERIGGLPILGAIKNSCH
ncbi:LOW QUALITY PROTEIN: hypothetical protein Cgig2_027769 [Carnegiea gigantea]|uniref:Uncharacterized protein n=1 Tax=Carnegiea gigantea TaxID=171969 RepID=A0A9Q1GPY2_9CARY|nr:LOW QUALITY PROTEIN: hypothetical protein Cgig2_027769 [Carnegiea gigantea]